MSTIHFVLTATILSSQGYKVQLPPPDTPSLTDVFISVRFQGGTPAEYEQWKAEGSELALCLFFEKDNPIPA